VAEGYGVEMEMQMLTEMKADMMKLIPIMTGKAEIFLLISI